MNSCIQLYVKNVWIRWIEESICCVIFLCDVMKDVSHSWAIIKKLNPCFPTFPVKWCHPRGLFLRILCWLTMICIDSRTVHLLRVALTVLTVAQIIIDMSLNLQSILKVNTIIMSLWNKLMGLQLRDGNLIPIMGFGESDRHSVTETGIDVRYYGL